MGTTNWTDIRASLNLTPEDEEQIRLEGELIDALVAAREASGMTQRQLADAAGLKQPVIARLEKAVHSPQVDTILRALSPLGYTLAVVPKGERPRM
jgi:ribosome-binding protein aMBF1 (putative translation factor)